MEKINVTIEGLVTFIDSNYTPKDLKDKAIEALEYYTNVDAQLN